MPFERLVCSALRLRELLAERSEKGPEVSHSSPLRHRLTVFIRRDWRNRYLLYLLRLLIIL